MAKHRAMGCNPSSVEVDREVTIMDTPERATSVSALQNHTVEAPGTVHLDTAVPFDFPLAGKKWSRQNTFNMRRVIETYSRKADHLPQINSRCPFSRSAT